MSDDRNASSSSSLIDTGISHSRKAVKSYGISIDSSKIHEVAVEEQPESLRELGVNVFDQDVFEEGVLQQVDEAIAAQEQILEKERLEKDLKTVGEQLRITEHQLSKTKKDQQAIKLLALDHENLIKKKEHLLQRLCIAKDIQEPGTGINNEEETGAHIERKESEISDEDSAGRLLQIRDHQETEIERLIRLGEMTPFGSRVDNDAQMDAEAVRSGEKSNKVDDKTFEKSISALSSEFEGEASTSKARTENLPVIESGDGIDYVDDDHNDVNNYDDYNLLSCFDDEEKDDSVPQLESDDDYIPDDEELKLSWKEELNMSDDETTQPVENVKLSVKAKKKKKHKSKPVKKTGKLHRTTRDDGDDGLFQKRIREAKLKKILREKGIDYSGKSDEEEESWDEDFPDEEFEGGLKIPGAVWNKLFRYQKTGVKWLWELHCQQAGGIVGDEMGLGKTIQLIAFLAGLKYSKIGRRSSKQFALGPVLIVCPATVMYQWVAEFHKWWPEFRVAVLHDTASYQGPKDSLISKIRNAPGVLITTYSGVRLNQEHLLPSRWDYVILDEGHTIRNPDAEVTLACKQFRTPHRIVLSGSPMQNNLRELWSLFDFVFPGKLGTLPVFMQEFSVPITMGGYANATQVQVQTAYKCACVLRDTINPYLLRRMKKDVKMKLGLPNKNEQVLFCRLTEEQTEIYKEYLDSREVGSILCGSMKVFPGLIMLRKICNHPDLTSEAGSLWKLRKDQEMAKAGRAVVEDENDSEYGYWKRSGKLVVVHSLLKLWKKQKHKVLLFTQTRQMLKILEIFVKSQGYVYCRMDGTTSISSRQPLVEKFNKEKSIFVFLLTTRVGGLGVNLVGANRVIIYDPDWNPGTDMQAKERAWRVGQKRDVTIYRLITTGTIEEKIYHRQIFKQFLTNRVLKDPKQRRFFKSNDLFELFTLDTSDNTKTGTETGAIFAGLGCEVKVPSPQRKGTKRKNTEPADRTSVLKMMKEKTKEILKSQFSRSREIGAVSNDDSYKSGIGRDNNVLSGDSNVSFGDNNVLSGDNNVLSGDNNVSSGDNSVDISGPPGIARQASYDDARRVSIRTPECTYDSDNTTKLNESITNEDSVKRNTNGGVCLEQFYAKRGSSDIKKPGSNPDLWDVSRAQASSEDLLGSDLDVVLEQTSSAGIENATKMKTHDVSSSVPRKEDKGKTKKKSKKKKRNKIEGIRIGQLSHSEPYPSKKDSEDGENKHDDDHYILRKLFKNSGVHSALQHDTIVNSGNSDHILVENEAQRVAAQAAEALKRSRERCMLDRSSGLPTWTGHSGIVGSPYGVQKKNIFGPKEKPKTQRKEDASKHFSGESLFGKADDETKVTAADPMSSTQLLARMRARNFIGGNNAGSEVPCSEQKYEQTMSEVRTFIATGCSRVGMATTREILEEFSARLPVSDSAIFRAMLRTICEFERGVSGEGYWVLKTEY